MSKIYPFLTQIAQHNNKEWLADNRSLYEQAKQEATAIFERIYQGVAAIDEVSELKIYRINRSFQFSAKEEPYKTYLGAYFRRHQPHNRGGYYLHLEPNNNYIAIGFNKPEPADLLKIRTEIAEFGEEFESIIRHEELVKCFGGLTGEEVKTAPKGFSKTHPQARYIAKKQFLLLRKFSEEEVLSDDFASVVVESFQKARPFVEFMTRALTA